LAYLDYDDFVKANYLDGKIYIDEKKETYKALDYGSKTIFSLYGLLDMDLYRKNSEASKKGITGNLKGDGFQLGGTIIVDREGNVVYSFKQSKYTDEPSEEDIIKAVENFIKQ
jgi:prostamide/prostaglandin F2alpha synthase